MLHTNTRQSIESRIVIGNTGFPKRCDSNPSELDQTCLFCGFTSNSGKSQGNQRRLERGKGDDGARNRQATHEPPHWYPTTELGICRGASD